MSQRLPDDAVMRSMIGAARPQTMAALMRYFRDLDVAEEAFQNACLRALQVWPGKGPPRDPVAWLVLVGRNAGVDEIRRQGRATAITRGIDPDPIDGAELTADRIDCSHYRDDLLLLLFICCHPSLPATQQVALALRVVCGLSPAQIANAFLIGETAMQQRLTRAKLTVAAAGIPFGPPSRDERIDRITAVSSIIYVIFNEGFSSTTAGDEAHALCVEAIRLARLLQSLASSNPETMGLLALLLLHQARWRARFDRAGDALLLRHQDRGRWDQDLIAEGSALLDKAMRHRSPGPYQIQAAIAAVHVRAPSVEETDWGQIEQLYAALERIHPSPVVALNRAVAVSELSGPLAGLDAIMPLEDELSRYCPFFGVKGELLLKLGRRDEARIAFDRAIALAPTIVDAIYIRAQLDQLFVGAGW